MKPMTHLTQGTQAITKTVHHIARGKIIELAEDLGVAEDQPVEVHMKIVEPCVKWGTGLRRSASDWSTE